MFGGHGMGCGGWRGTFFVGMGGGAESSATTWSGTGNAGVWDGMEWGWHQVVQGIVEAQPTSGSPGGCAGTHHCHDCWEIVP